MKRLWLLSFFMFIFSMNTPVNNLHCMDEKPDISTDALQETQQDDTQIQEILELTQEVQFFQNRLFQVDQELFGRIKFFVNRELSLLDQADTAQLSLLRLLIDWHKNLMARLIVVLFQGTILSYEDFLHINAQLLYSLMQQYEEFRIMWQSHSITLGSFSAMMQTSSLDLLHRLLSSKLKKNCSDRFCKIIGLNRITTIFYGPSAKPTLDEIITTDLYAVSPQLCNQLIQLMSTSHNALIGNNQPYSQDIHTLIDTAQQDKNSLISKELESGTKYSKTNKVVIKIYTLINDALFKMLYEQTALEQASSDKFKVHLLKIRTFIHSNDYFKQVIEQQQITPLVDQFSKVIDVYVHQNQNLGNLFYEKMYPLILQVQSIKKGYESRLGSLFYSQKGEYHLMVLMLDVLIKISQEIKQTLNDPGITSLCNQLFEEHQSEQTSKSWWSFFVERIFGATQKRLAQAAPQTQATVSPWQTITPVIVSKLFDKLLLNDEKPAL